MELKCPVSSLTISKRQSLLDLIALKRRTRSGQKVALDNTRHPVVPLSPKSKPSQEKASSQLLGSIPLKVRSVPLAKLMVWILPTRNSRDCKCVKFFPGDGGRGKLQGFGNLSIPGPWSIEVGVAQHGTVTWKPVPLPRASDAHSPHQGRQVLLQSTRCQASTPEHFGNHYSAPLLSFLLTQQQMSQTLWAPAHSLRSLHTHSTQTPPPSTGWELDSSLGLQEQKKGKHDLRSTAQA